MDRCFDDTPLSCGRCASSASRSVDLQAQAAALPALPGQRCSTQLINSAQSSLKPVVHWLRVSAVIAEVNMGCYRCYGLGASARTNSR